MTTTTELAEVSQETVKQISVDGESGCKVHF